MSEMYLRQPEFICNGCKSLKKIKIKQEYKNSKQQENL